MADNLALLVEAEKRGILPAGKKALLDEARKRGLVGGDKPMLDRAIGADNAASVRGVVGNLAEGVPFGDEIASGLSAAYSGTKDLLSGRGATYGDRYDDALRLARGDTKAFQRKNPATSVALNVAGSIPTVLMAPQATVARGAGMGAKMANAGINAAGYGALYGFGGGEGGAAERLKNAGVTAAVAGPIGLLAPPVASTIGSLGRAALSKVAPSMAQTAAINRVARAMRDDGLTPDDVTAALSRDSNTFMADLGENLRNLGATAGKKPGPGRQMAHEAVAARQVGQQDRLLDAVSDNVSGAMDSGQFIDDIMSRASKSAAPLYDKAYAAEFSVSPKLAELAKRPAVQKALTRAQEIAANEGDDLSQPSFKIWDYIKRGLDDVVDSNTNEYGKLDEVGRAANGVRRELLQELDAINPDYKAARAAYAGPASIRGAAETGRQFLRMSPHEIEKAVGSMSPDQLAAARVGVADALKTEIAGARDHNNAALRLLQSPKRREQLARIIGQDPVALLKEVADQEMHRFATYARTTGGSPTFQLSAEDNAAVNLADTLKGGKTALVGKLLDSIRTGAMSREEARVVAALLFQNDPLQMRSMVTRIGQAAAPSSRAGVKAGAMVGAPVGSR